MHLLPLEPRAIAQVLYNLRAADRRELEATLHRFDSAALAEACAVVRFGAVAAAADGTPVAVIGANELWPGVYQVGLFATPRWPEVALGMTRFARGPLTAALLAAGAHRAQAFSLAGHAEAHRWLSRLGARREALLRGWGRGGEDFLLFAWHRTPAPAAEPRHQDDNARAALKAAMGEAMTLATDITEVSYAGDGVTTVFPVTFPFFGADELELLARTTASGAEMPLQLGLHYSVAGGNGTSGSVTATTPPPVGVEWHIFRHTKRLQQTDYVENDPFPAQTHERALDRLTAEVQELDGGLSRAVKVSKTSPLSESDLTLPEPTENWLLGFGGNGALAKFPMPIIPPLKGDLVNLKDYFGVAALSDSASNLAKLQDAARSGLDVFVDPGTYLVDPTTGLLFDATATIFKGAGSRLVRFKSADVSEGEHNLFVVSVDNCEVLGVSFEGEESAGTATQPNVASHILVSKPGGRTNGFTVRDVFGIGGRNVVFCSRVDNLVAQNIRGKNNYIHVISAGEGQRNCMIDGVFGDGVGAEVIALGTNNEGGFGVQTDMVQITRVQAVNCGINPAGAPGAAAGPTEAIDLFLRSSQNVVVSDVLVKNCGAGGLELKRGYDANLPNFSGRTIIRNVQMFDEVGHIGTGAGNLLLRLNWSTPVISIPQDTNAEIRLENLVARYAATAPATGICVNVKDQTDLTIAGLEVTGPIGAAIRFDDADGGGIGAMGKRIKLHNLVTAGCQDAIVIAGANIDQLSFSGAIDINCERNPIVASNAHVRNFAIDGGILRNIAGSGQAAIEINNSVIQGTIKGVQTHCDLGLLHAATFAVTPATAILPGVSNITNSGGLCRVDFVSVHGLASSDVISISGVTGTTEANGTWRVTVIDADTVDLQESAFSNAYVSGGTVRRASDLRFEDCAASLFSTLGASGAFRLDHDVYVRAHRVSAQVAINARGFSSSSSGNYKFRGRLFRGYLAAAPASTAGSVGDFFLSHAPAAGGVEGWICTTAGTTVGAIWKEFGTIAA